MDRGIRINLPAAIALLGLLIPLLGAMVALGQKIESRADRAEVAELQRQVSALDTSIAALASDSQWTVSALERLENRIDGATTRPYGPGRAGP